MRCIVPGAVALAAMLACAGQADAQIIGFKLGAASSTLDVEDNDLSARSITGFAGGAYFRFALGERLGIQIEVLSIQKGADLRAEDPADNIDVRLDYLEVPLLLHVPIGASETFTPYAVAGPTVGFETRCRATRPEGQAEDCSAAGFERSSPDFGLAAGGGLAFLLGPGILLLEGRYTWGLTDLNVAADDTGSIRNRSAVLTAGFVVPLGRRY